jgi:hypothetical protein
MGTRIERFDGRDFEVRRVTGSAATRAYRCPGCGQTIRPATPHVVAWPVIPTLQTALAAGEGVDERRHWHSACWAARDRRR